MINRPRIFRDGRGKQIAFVALVALGQGVATGLTAFATRDVFHAMASKSTTLPLVPLMLIILGGLVLTSFRFFERVLAEKVGQSYAAAVRECVFLHMSKQPIGNLAVYRKGAMSLRFVGDLSAIKGWVAFGISRLLSSGVTITSSILILFFIRPTLAFAAFPAALLALLVIWLLGSRLEQAYIELRQRRSRLAADMTERLPQGVALRQIGRFGKERNALTNHSDQVATAAIKKAAVSGILRSVPDVTAALLSVTVLVLAIKVGLSVAESAAALTTVALTIRPLRQLAGVWDRRQAWTVATRNLERLLSAPALPGLKRRPVRADNTHPALVIDQATLPNGRVVSARVETGEWVSVKGVRDADVTATLLCASGMELVPEGKIRIFGRKPFGTEKHTINYIGAFSPILKGSLRRNLILGSSKTPSDSVIEELVEDAGLQDLIGRLGGLDGRVSESASNLSREEMTKLLCVRAVLLKPKLLLADAADLGSESGYLNFLARHLKPSGCSALVSTRNTEALAPFTRHIQLNSHLATETADAEYPTNITNFPNSIKGPQNAIPKHFKT